MLTDKVVLTYTNGIIKVKKVIASNIRNKIYNASSFSPSQIEGLLAEGKSVNFSTSGEFDVIMIGTQLTYQTIEIWQGLHLRFICQQGR